MVRVVWTRRALKKLLAIQRYTEQHDPVVARDLYDRLRAAGEPLATFPHRGGPVEEGRRELPNVPPYVLIYRVTREAVVVLFIRHGRQRPGA